MTKHVRDIAEKYLVPGETHDTAFMFVPSESVFAEIHENFDQVVQLAYRSRVIIVSPSLLLLSIQVIQQVLKDHRLREQAHVIQDEVRMMMLDVDRLDERVRKLASHFGMAREGHRADPDLQREGHEARQCHRHDRAHADRSRNAVLAAARRKRSVQGGEVAGAH